jgi:hypothetical protein
VKRNDFSVLLVAEESGYFFICINIKIYGSQQNASLIKLITTVGGKKILPWC